MQQLKTYKEAFGYTAQVSDFDYGFSITYNCYLVILFTTSAMAFAMAHLANKNHDGIFYDVVVKLKF